MMAEAAPDTPRKRRRRTPRTWTGRAASYFGVTKRQVQAVAYPALGLLGTLLAVYWMLHE